MNEGQPMHFGKGPKDWLIKPRIVEVIRRSIIDSPPREQPQSFGDYTAAPILIDEEHRSISLGDLSQEAEYWLESLLICTEGPLADQRRTVVMQKQLEPEQPNSLRGRRYVGYGATITTGQWQELRDKSLGLCSVDKNWFLHEVDEASRIVTARRIGKDT